jgi:hypothetical protein
MSLIFTTSEKKWKKIVEKTEKTELKKNKKNRTERTWRTETERTEKMEQNKKKFEKNLYIFNTLFIFIRTSIFGTEAGKEREITGKKPLLL